MREAYLYQTVHVLDGECLCLREHLAVLDRWSRTLFGCPGPQDAREVGTAIAAVAGREAPGSDRSKFVRLVLPASGSLRLEFEGVSLYRGHAALVDEALNLFDRVVIGIGNNTSKQGLLTVVNRKRLIDDLYAGNARVEARIYTGLTGEFAEEMGACAIIRGVRNTTDFEYERTMEATNHRIYPDITTVMLFTPAPVADISSSTVREVLSFGRSVEEFMPVGVDINKYL